MESITLTVEGMSCNHCVNTIEKNVGALTGVEQVSVDLAAKAVAITFNKEAVTEDTLKETIENQGFDVV